MGEVNKQFRALAAILGLSMPESDEDLIDPLPERETVSRYAIKHIQQLEAQLYRYRWISVETLPDDNRLVECVMEYERSKTRCRFFGHYVRDKTLEASESEFGEYDEATDEFWCPEGWYEKATINWDIECSSVQVTEGEVIAWREVEPLPLTEEA